MSSVKNSSTKTSSSHGRDHREAEARKRERSHGDGPVSLRDYQPEKFISNQSFPGFYLLKTIGVQETFPTIRIDDIILPAADLAVVCNYNFDVSWFWQRAPAIQTCRKVLLVHGERVNEEKAWKVFFERECANDRVRFVRPKTPMYGTVHSKVFALFYPNGCRICIHTANMVQQDWDYKTQGAYVRDFPLMQGQCSQKAGNRDFKNQLLRYFTACLKSPEREDVLKAIEKYDFSSAGVALILSIPGVHEGEQMAWFGHMRLRSVLQEFTKEPNDDSVAVCQFSSLGSIQENWLEKEFCTTLFANMRASKSKKLKRSEEIQLVYPTLSQVQKSNEGIAAGASLPVPSRNMHREHITNRLYKWDASISKRERAMPHIKTFLRYPRSQPHSPLWVLLGSFNLSVAAWGRILKPAKNNSVDRIKILSFEMGVLFTPHLSCPAVFRLDHCTIFRMFSSHEQCLWSEAEKECSISLRLCGSIERETENGDGQSCVPVKTRAEIYLPIPYKLPAEQYQAKDTPWTVDLCSMT